MNVLWKEVCDPPLPLVRQTLQTMLQPNQLDEAARHVGVLVAVIPHEQNPVAVVGE